ncbi:replication endonuclease [Chitinimonas koreensis]|uniref:replication endonuclease n=1 Tax=Chitinimonas koreensis TaxID=356302 RepID=UPI0004052A14|nr:replication endonuclease [Chitinimonas koreensis]QNM96419.1 replication endonuclease [Chitinimonas koreensis]
MSWNNLDWHDDGTQQTDAEWLADNCPPEFRRRQCNLELDGADYQRARLMAEMPAGTVELTELTEELRRWIGHDETTGRDLEDLAKRGADCAGRLLTWLDPEEAADMLREALPWLRLPQPSCRGITAEGLGMRMVESTTWRRYLRREHEQRREVAAMVRGEVMAGRDAYCSQRAYRDHTARQRSSRRAIEDAEIVSEDGEILDLAAAVDASVSNSHNRLAELAVRGKGMELIAEAHGHSAAFVTVTAPGAFHASHRVAHKRSRGRQAYTQEINPAWIAAGRPSPAVASSYLCGVFADVRTVAKNAGLHVYGIRTAEPHADGCPHWHMLIFGDRATLKQYLALFEQYACLVDAHELEGTVRVKRLVERRQADGTYRAVERWQTAPRRELRFFAKWLRPAKLDADGKRRGGPLAYLLKYLTKNLHGENDQGRAFGDDHEAGGDTATAASRVRAWASLWHIRQFQQFGDAPVGVWRELRRLRGKAIDDDGLALAVEAACANDWAGYHHLHQAAQLVLFKEPAEQPNRYGEPQADRVVGVFSWSTEAKALTRTKVWKINWRAKSRRSGAAATERAARPRICTNNCADHPPEQSPETASPSSTAGFGDARSAPSRRSAYLNPDFSDDAGPPPWADPAESRRYA